jgi:flavin-dependent dehydrogenase
VFSANLIAVVGGGPAGATAAAALAHCGRQVILFDEKLVWEKPCGGGLPQRALDEWPFLNDSSIEPNTVNRCELISPAGRRVVLSLEQPITIVSRCALNGLLLARARQAGAQIVRERVVDIERTAAGWLIRSNCANWQANYLVIAAGARNSFRKQLSQPFAPDDLMVTAGYYIPGRSQLMRIQFLPDVHGYVWVFPRADHFSAGICGKMHGHSTAELRSTLEETLLKFGLQYEGTQFFSHVLPSLSADTLRRAPLSGDGWAMIGDAAGLVDSITGEGLYYAMKSADLLAQAVLAGEPNSYPTLLRRDLLPELEMAARMADRFYAGTWMGETVIERTIQFIGASESSRRLMSDLFAGSQGYRDLRRRLYTTLPAMLAESLASALRLPKNQPKPEPRSRVA